MKAHRTDGVSLSFAVIFLGIAAWWLVAQLLDLALPAVGWFVAGGLILLGVLGLLGALRAGRAGAAPAEATSATVPVTDPSGAGAFPAAPVSGTPVTALLVDTPPASAPPVADPDDSHR